MTQTDGLLFNPNTYDPQQRFFSWLFRILKNECLNVLRGRRPSEPVSLSLPTSEQRDPQVWRV